MGGGGGGGGVNHCEWDEGNGSEALWMVMGWGGGE